MATYTITLNERTASGKALMDYLQALGVLVQKVTPAKKSSYERSQDDIREGRVEKFASADDMFKSLGIIALLIALTTTFIGCNQYNRILEDVYDKDQSVREWTHGMASLSADEIVAHSYEMERIDSLNQAMVFGILDKEGWPSRLSDKANRAIWLVIDHSDATNRSKYLDFIQTKAEEGVLSKSDYATLKDRTLMENGMAQIYGTQIKMAATAIGEDISMQLYLWPVGNADTLDSLRNTVGLSPIEEYLKACSEKIGQKIVWDKTKTTADFQHD